ncbi:MAG: hypothetical protein KatS3mg103_1221 [Phycisphaerales bacterium]|nr:MAG: hypothetical protein KatS3mg103_1221 [Phycisphaerales bacterium]
MHLAPGLRSLAQTVSSPALVRINGPSATTRSARSVRLARAKPLAEQSRLLTATCSWPVASRRFIHTSLPLSRSSTTRPATRTTGLRSWTAGAPSPAAWGLSWVFS